MKSVMKWERYVTPMRVYKIKVGNDWTKDILRMVGIRILVQIL